MKSVLNVILAASFVVGGVSTVSANAFAQAPTSGGTDVTSSSLVQFNTNVARPVPSAHLIPAVAYGSSSFATASTPGNVQMNPTSGSHYEAGVLAEMGRGTFVFQTGLMYISEEVKTGLVLSNSNSGNLTPTINHATLDGTVKYLGVPFVGKTRVRVANGVRLAGRFGVMPAIAMSSQTQSTNQVTDSFGTVIDQRSSSSSDSSGLRSVNCFALIGGGPEFRIARDQNIRFEANYERMLFSLAKSDADISITMQSINAMLSYGIGF